MIKKITEILAVLLICIYPAIGQVDSLHTDKPYIFSVEDDILDLKVQSTELYEITAASRRQEPVSETITSSYLITADEIKQSGAITLSEALQLAPGVLVRQKTNGYFDVSIRGASGTINSQNASGYENTTVMLTINGIPFSNWFQGGILWETVPVELHDILQIEVIASPSTVFFGPNAATGVINIVTKEVEEKNLQANVRLQGGMSEDYTHTGNASFGVSERLKFRLSGHYHRLTRSQNNFYLLNEQRYIPSDSLLYYQASARETNQSAEKSLRSTGINAFATFLPNSKTRIEAMVGTKESYLQSLLHPIDRVALTNRNTTTNIAALRAQFRNFQTSVSYRSGKHDLAVGYNGFEMRTENLYASTEYNYIKSVYQAKLGGDVNYNVFRNELPQGSEELVAAPSLHNPALLGTTSLYNVGLFANQSLSLFDKQWKVMLTVRGDQFSLTDHFYGSYQLGSVYHLGKRHILRGAISNGLGNFSAQNYLFYDETTASYDNHQNLNALNVRTYEAGYRVTPYQDLRFGITYFQNTTSNFIDSLGVVPDEKVNSDISRMQQGVTMDMQWSVNKLKATAFLTIQNTNTRSGSRTFADPSVPSFIGGLTGNYRMFLNKLRINAGLYCYGGTTATETNATYSLPAKLITNCRISYNVWDDHAVFFNGRNVLNDSQHEVPYADHTKSLYMLGVDLVF